MSNRTHGGNFVNYLPQDEVVGTRLNDNEKGVLDIM
jgi:hypothetical protein